MKQLLVRIDEDVEEAVRRLVRSRYGARRGGLSLLVEEALRSFLRPEAEISTSTLLEVVDYVAGATEGGRSKDEILANVYIMLDREFEQSITRGVRDLKEGRIYQVPPGSDPVKYLRGLANRKI